MQVQPAIDVDFADGVRTLHAAGPRHHHGGRDPRPRHRRHGGAGGAHRATSCCRRCTPTTRRRAVTRLLDLGVPPYLLSSTLLGVMAQRLVRTLVPALQEAGEPPDDGRLAHADRAIPRRAAGAACTLPVGCLECRMTGYYGRIGLYEIMTLSPTLRRLIHVRGRRWQDPRAGLQAKA